MNKYIKNVGDKLKAAVVVAVCCWSTFASAVTVLNGQLVLKSEDDPDVTSMINHGKPIQYRAIQLNQPRSFTLLDELENEERTYKNQRYIQLVTGSYGDLKNIKLMSKVRVTCDELYTQHSVHHFTEVLCVVKRVEVLK